MSKKKKKRPDPETLNLPLCGVESHAHLDLEDFSEDLEEVLDHARRAGVAKIVNVFLGPDAYQKNKGLFDGHPEVSFIMAVHPNETKAFGPDHLERMKQAFESDPRLKAVGETGLDFYWDRVPPGTQARAFAQHLDLAREVKRPVVIHSRDAEPETMAILLEKGFKDYPLLWHCFGGNIELANRILDNGWMISIPGPVTYKKNDSLREAVAKIPLDRLMVETDCPYLSPEPWRGKRNHPALMGFTATRIAEIKGLEPAEVWKACAENATRFFGL